LELTQEQRATLRDEMETDPEGLGYGKHLASEPGWIVDLINKPAARIAKTRWVTAIALLSLLDVGVVRKLLVVLRDAATTDPIADLLLVALKSDRGINIADQNTKLVLETLVGTDSLPREFADQLLDLAIQPGSRAEALFGEGAVIAERDVLSALKGR
jgi:hypothetical protein